MKYFIKQKTDIQTLIIEASGIINTNVARKMVFATGSELKKSGFQKCLFDLVYTQVDPNQSMTEMFMFIEAFKQAGIAKSVKMAALYVTGGEYRLFLDKSAALEGYKLKHFTNRENAFNWLEL